MDVGTLVGYIDLDDKGFDRGVSKVEGGLRKLETATTASTGRMESGVSRGFDRLLGGVERTLGSVEQQAGKSGQASGSAFTSGLDRALDAVDQVAGRAGRDAGTSFLDEAREVLRYGDLGVDVDAEITSALAAIATVEQALDGLDDERVKVDVDATSATSTIGRLTDAAGGLGSKLESAIGVIGQTTPGQVALAIGAIAALPLAAQVASAGIVLALGGALATVGFTSAASADRVKYEWSETASQLKRELGDVAAPLEDSAIHASGVARDAFQALKPILREVFADMGPDVDHFVDGLGRAVARIGPSLKPLGEAFGELLRSLGDRADDWGGDLAEAFTTFAETTTRHADDIANLFTAITTSIRMTADATSFLADRWDGFLSVNEGLHSSLLGINRDYDGTQATLAGMNTTVDEAIAAVQGLGDATTEGGAAVRSLSAALEDLFDPAQKALDAEIRLKSAIEDATQAAKNQGMSEVERLRSVQDLTRAIADAAKAEVERTGKTEEAGKAFMAQLPTLQEWAGKNAAAKATVDALGQSLGVTTVQTDKGKFAIDALGNAVKILPSGKTVKVDANTAAGKKQLEEIKRKLDDLKNRTIYIDIISRTFNREESIKKQQMPARAGALIDGGVKKFAAGGVQAYAAGGRSTPPNVASNPTILYGEGSAPEYFIPTENRYRPRAIDLLSQAAEDFGLEVYNKAAGKRVTALATTVSDANTQLGGGIKNAVTALEATLGKTGTLTTTISDVGAVGEQMTASWEVGADTISDSVQHVATVTADGVTLVSQSVDTLTMSVQELAAAIQRGAVGDGKGKGKSATQSAIEAALDAARGAMGGGSSKAGWTSAASKAAQQLFDRYGPKIQPRPPGGTVEGDYGSGGYMSDSANAFTSGKPPGGVTVNMYDTTISSDVDVSKVGQEFAFDYRART
ncbi:hypothetical protein ACBJ59_12140 [Nonomuraea sp. MTCD27]|uniref:hypothetical protein n=1 Tax=Nonomuraea sp. MTCD27 TaxID=1676747 RepID=UPI0035C2060F